MGEYVKWLNISKKHCESFMLVKDVKTDSDGLSFNLSEKEYKIVIANNQIQRITVISLKYYEIISSLSTKLYAKT